MNGYAACPKCGAANARLLSFTWWGGALGPRILTHVKCENCGAKYNGKTGRDNTVGILIYSAVAGVLGFILFLLAAFFLYSR